MKKRLSFANRIWIGFTLFSMFFGIGSFVFVPFLGYQAGGNWGKGLAGFFVSAVVFPVLGIGAAAAAGGIDKLARRIHPCFATLFCIMLYLFIGPLFAIPKAASTSCSIVLLPFFGRQIAKWVQPGYLSLFFLLVYLMSLHPERLPDWIGRWTVPCILFFLVLIFTGCVFWPVGRWKQPELSYRMHPVLWGFLEGRRTMNGAVSLSFSLILSLIIRFKGVAKERDVFRESIYSGGIAGGVLLLVCAVLSHIGSITGSKLTGAENGIGVMTWAAKELYGKNGQAMLAVLFFLSCFHVCVGLICCTSKYFSALIPRISYQKWAAVFSGISLWIACKRLSWLLNISALIVQIFYPMCIVLVLLSFFHRWIWHLPLVYPFCVFFAGIVSGAECFEKQIGEGSLIGRFLEHLPGYGLGLGWMFAAAVGAVIGAVCSRILKNSYVCENNS